MKQEDTKKRILEKSLELFAANGYDSVSVGEIASAVGIKAPSLYSHFQSKQAIFDAIVADTSRQFEKFTDTIKIHVRNFGSDTALFSDITEKELIGKVHKIINFTMHDESIALFRKMMTIEQFRTPELSKLYSERFVERLIRYHAGIFKTLIAEGVLKNENPETLSLMYVAPIITLIGVCDRQPEREAECIKMLDEHIGLFYRTFNSSNP